MRRAGRWALLLLALAPGPARGLSLEELLLRVAAEHESARIAELEYQASDARVRKARAFFFPTLTARGTYTHRASEAVRDLGDSTVVAQRQDSLQAVGTLSMSIFDARSIPLYRRALLEREAQSYATAETKRLLAFEAADAYLLALGLERELEAARHRLDFAAVTLADARARLEAALVGTNDVTRPELDLANAERELATRAAAVEEAYLALGLLAAMEVRGPLSRPAALVQAEATTSTAGDGGAALERRPDLMARRKRVQAAEALASEPLLRLIPSLSLSGELRATDDAGLSGKEIDGLLSFNLSWTLYDGGLRYADRAELSALAEASALELRLAERGAALSVERAAREIAARRTSKQAAERAMRVAERNAAEVSELYRQGLARALEVSDANLRRFEAELGLAREEYSLWVALLDLRAARGQDPLGKDVAP